MAEEKWDVLCDQAGTAIWLVPLGPELEVATKVGEAVSCLPGPGRLGPMVTLLFDWRQLAGFVAGDS